MMNEDELNTHLIEGHGVVLPVTAKFESLVRRHHALHEYAGGSERPIPVVHFHQRESEAASGEEHLGLPHFRDPQQPASEAAWLAVDYLDGQIRTFPISELGGWKICTRTRMLIVGHGVPRTHIPLDSVASFQVNRHG